MACCFDRNRLTTLLAIAVLALPVVAAAGGKQKAGSGSAENAAAGKQDAASVTSAIFQKLEYDLSYFERILTLEAQGKTDRKLSKAQFDTEVRRARANLPVLKRIFAEKAAYASGRPLSLPGNDEVHRVYSNLITVLNMAQGTEAGDWKAVVRAGQQVLIKDPADFGQVRANDSRYYLNLYREFFYLMALAHYRLGKDAEAVNWLARIESDANIQKLRKRVETQNSAPSDTRAERLALLQTRSLAILPLTSLQKSEETEWIGPGIAEVLANDLLQHSDLLVVERTQISKVLKEVALSQAGITEGAAARDVGKMLSAGSLLVGSYRPAGEKVWVSLRIVDAEDGRAVASAEAELRNDELFADTRALATQLLGSVGWLSDTTREELVSSHAPRSETIRDLLKARLVAASRSDDARALFAKAMKEDPAYARLFEDLQVQFKDVTSTVAVMPFVNTAGIADELWMAHAASEALSTDLPKMGFNVVERAQLALQLEERQLGQVIDPQRARELGELSGADFVVVGSVLHQKGRVRIDCRFTDVRSGLVLNAVSADGDAEQFPKLLVNLSVEIARRFNEKLSDATISQLMGQKMGPAEFEKMARQQLASEAVARKVNPITVKDEPSRAPFWIAAGGAVAGTALAATGFVFSDIHGDSAAYSEALLQFATRPDDLSRLTAERDAEAKNARNWSYVAYGGIGLAVVSVGYIVYQELRGPPTTRTTIEPAKKSEASVQPLVAVDGRQAVLGIAGSF